MNRKSAITDVGRIVILSILSLAVVSSFFITGLSQSSETDNSDRQLDPAFMEVWETSDMPVAEGEVNTSWTWGPVPLAATTEFYKQSPTGTRRMVYFDKGRLDILDPEADSESDDYVTAAPLVREMLSGRIQFGEDAYVGLKQPDIPITGDPKQPHPITYRDLAPLSSVWDSTRSELEPGEEPQPAPENAAGEQSAEPAATEQPAEQNAAPEEEAPETNRAATGNSIIGFTSDAPATITNDDRESTKLRPVRLMALDEPLRVGPRIDEQVTTVLRPDGHLVADGYTESSVSIGAYDETLGHNIAAPFVEWAEAHQFDKSLLLGHPITEPYWIQTQMRGEPEWIMIQAFERRLLTYSPSNPDGWKVESANAGRHYRNWRNLTRPEDSSLLSLANNMPFGEEIVAAARAHNIDPYMLAAISMIASGGNPFATMENGGQGLTGVIPPAPADPEAEPPNLNDPWVNANLGAERLASWIPAGSGEINWDTVLQSYYNNAPPTWSNPEQRFADSIIEKYRSMSEEYPLGQEPMSAEELLFGGVLQAGPAAYYDPSYDVAWWEKTLRFYESIGLIADNWQYDPNGYYCVRPGYIPGERLQLQANGVTITCTVGDMVADQDLYGWLKISGWSVEMSWRTFTALKLDQNNWVEVNYPGPTPNPEPPIPPTETPTPEPTETPTPSPSPSPTEEPSATPTAPEPSPSPTPSAEPTPTETPQPPASPTQEPTATPVPPSPSPAPTQTAEPEPSPSPEQQQTAPPSPTVTPTAQLSATPTAKPTPSPEPTATPAPEPSVTAAPEPTVTAAPEPTATSVPTEPTTTTQPSPTSPPVVSATEGPAPTATEGN